MKKKLIVTGPLVGDGLSRLADEFELVHATDGLAVVDGVGVMNQERFDRELPEAWGIASVDRLKIDAARLATATNLKVIANHGAGVDNIDIDSAKQHGVVVANIPDPVREPTADLGWTLLMATARHVVEGDRIMRSGQYAGWKNDFLLGQLLEGKTLGIFGCGRIGQTVARRARGWDMPVIYQKRTRLDESTERELNATWVDFDTLLAESDFLIITAPLTDETRHKFDRAAFARMKRSAVFVNIGRGAVVCETDLVAALQAGEIWGAGLDVYETSPGIAPGLADCPRTTLLPYIGSASFEARKLMGDMTAQILLDVHEGREPAHVLTG